MAVISTDWEAVQNAILAWFEDLSAEVSDVGVYWRDDVIHHYGPGITAQILLHIATIEPRGVKNISYESTGADGSKMSVPKSSQLLRITLDVSVQAGSPVPGSLATTLLQGMGIRAEVAELREDLDALPIALSSVGPITSVQFEQDGHRLTQATSQWILFLHDVWQDDGVSVETIENVHGVGTVPNDVIVELETDDDGALIP